MSHIHLPDGALPANVLLFGLLATCALLVVATRQIRRHNLAEYMPRMAFVSALLLVVMSIPLGLLPVHANLSVLAGVLLGPWLAIFSAFIVNLFLAFIGHGTTAMIGINTLVLATEMVAGYILVRGLGRIMNRQWAAALAVILTLALTGTTVFWGLSSLGFDVEAIVSHDHNDEHAHTGVEGHEHEHEHEHGVGWALLAVIIVFLTPGIIFETLLTFLLMGLLLRVRPQLIDAHSGGRA